MIDAAAFLQAVDTSRSEAAVPVSGQRLATVDPAYVSGKPRVTFDGDTTMSIDGFTFATSYNPKPGDRVVMMPVGNTWAIAGAVGDAPAGPAGSAGGDLSGSYPNPAIKAALLNPVAATPGLRSLGLGSQQAAAGDHSHEPSNLTDSIRYYSRYNGAGAQSVSNVNNTAVEFGSASVTGSWLARTAFSSGHFFSVQVAGLWAVTATVRFVAGAASGERYASLVTSNINATQQVATAAGGFSTGAPVTFNLNYTAYFAVGEFAFVEVYQSTGAPLNLDGGAPWRNFNMSLIRRAI